MCNKAVSSHPSTIQFVPDRFKTHEMCDKGLDSCLFAFDSAADWYITQEFWDKVTFEVPFMLKYCPDVT